MFYIVYLAIGLIMAYLVKGQQRNNRASGIEDVSVPTVSGSRNINYAPGKNRISGPNCFYYGDLKSTPIKKKSGPGLFSKKVTVGHKYFLKLALSIGYGQGALRAIYWGDQVAWEGDISTETSININNKSLFGKPKEEGGVSVDIDFYPGTKVQNKNAKLESSSGVSLPAYRNISYVVIDGYIGNSVSIRNIEFIYEMYPVPFGFNPAHKKIGEDANPVFIIVDLMINTLYGIGVPQQFINVQTFVNAAETLFNENFGLSFNFGTTQSAANLISEILKYIDGALYQDTNDGKLSIKLIRADYDVNTILSLTDSSIVNIEKYSRGSISSFSSEVKISFINRDENYQEQVEFAQNPANQLKTGYANSILLSYPGIKTKQNAAFIAARELIIRSTGLPQMIITTNRVTRGLFRGAVFKASSDRFGLSEIILRVINIDYGSLKNGSIRIECVEDKFSNGRQFFDVNQNTDWTDAIKTPVDVVNYDLLEMPYRLTNENGPMQYLSLVARPAQSNLEYDLVTNTSSATSTYLSDGDDFSFNLFALANADISFNATSIVATLPFSEESFSQTIDDAAIRDSLVNFGYISDGSGSGEFIAFTTIAVSNTTLTLSNVKRGLLDTPPKSWPASSRIWVLDGFGYSENIYLDSVTVYNKFLTQALNGQLEESAATAHSITLDASNKRFDRPYPVANLTLDGITTPNYWDGEAINLEWSERNRKNLSVQFQDDASETPETNTTYNVTIRRADTSAIIDSATGLIVNSHSYSEFDEASDNPNGTINIYSIEIKTIRDSIENLRDYIFNLNRVFSKNHALSRPVFERKTRASNLLIFNSDRKMQSSINNDTPVIINYPISSGKFAIELTLDTTNFPVTHNPFVGAVNAGHVNTNNQFIGFTSSGWGMAIPAVNAEAGVYNNNAPVGATALSTSTPVMLLIDADANPKTITWRQSNTNIDSASITSDTLYFAASNNSINFMTVNSGDSAFTNTLPAGYSAMPTIFYDNFLRPDENILSGSWATQSNSGIKIVSNLALPVHASNLSCSITTETVNNDQFAEMIIDTHDTEYVSVRASSSDQSKYIFGASNDGTGDANKYKIIVVDSLGGMTDLLISPTLANNGDRVRLECTGAGALINLNAYVNDVKILTASGLSVSNQINSGKPGICLKNNSKSSQFICGNLA